MEKKLKHLEFIQNIITRMGSNSFMMKGWAVTLLSALFALAAAESNQIFALITFIPVTAFWVLDAYFLSQERRYRALYKEVAENKTEANIDFSLEANGYAIWRKYKGKDNKGYRKNTWFCSMFSSPMVIFYLVLMGTSLLVMDLVNWGLLSGLVLKIVS